MPSSNPPERTPPAQPVLTNEQLVESRIVGERARLLAVLNKLRIQVTNPTRIDKCVSCLSPETAVDGRLPFTVPNVITIPSVNDLLNSLIGKAILAWGVLARKEGNPTNPHLVKLEEIAEKGVRKYGAYPVERNSTIHTLRTVQEELEVRQKRAEAEEKALEAKAEARIREEENGENDS